MALRSLRAAGGDAAIQRASPRRRTAPAGRRNLALVYVRVFSEQNGATLARAPPARLAVARCRGAANKSPSFGRLLEYCQAITPL